MNLTAEQVEAWRERWRERYHMAQEPIALKAWLELNEIAHLALQALRGGEPVLAGYVREWEGDDSDLGNMLYCAEAEDRDEPVERWHQVYYLDEPPQGAKLAWNDDPNHLAANHRTDNRANQGEPAAPAEPVAWMINLYANKKPFVTTDYVEAHDVADGATIIPLVAAPAEPTHCKHGSGPDCIACGMERIWGEPAAPAEHHCDRCGTEIHEVQNGPGEGRFWVKASHPDCHISGCKFRRSLSEPGGAELATPRTDEFTNAMYATSCAGADYSYQQEISPEEAYGKAIDFARQLERELVALRAASAPAGPVAWLIMNTKNPVMTAGPYLQKPDMRDWQADSWELIPLVRAALPGDLDA